MSQVVFEVQMHCSGCSNAITNILTKVEGVAAVDCSVEAKTVTVTLAAENAPEASALEEKINVWAEAADKPMAVRLS
jgi:copper chaperone CopZ